MGGEGGIFNAEGAESAEARKRAKRDSSLRSGRTEFVCAGARLKIAEEVTDGFGAIVDGGAAYFGKVEAGVEGIREGIGRIEIDFADYASVAGRFGALKKIGVKSTGVAFAAGGGGSDYAIDVDEIGVVFVVVIFLARFFEESAEPQKIDMLIA